MVDQAVEMLECYDYQSKLLAASIRTVDHVHNVISSGAHIATLPVKVFEKMLKHPLTEKGIKKFNDDWKQLGVKTFPAV